MQASNIVPFAFESNTVRVVTDERGEPWFVGADVCAALGHTNPSVALGRLDDDERNTLNIADGNRGNPNTVVISEPGVYRLVFTSRVDGAERFKRWLAHDVLPSIRKTGAYSVPSVAQPLLPAEVVSRMASVATVRESVAMLAGLVPGLKHGMVGAIALDAVQRATGQDVSDLRKLLPAAEGSLASMNATALGKALGLSAPKANALLASRGLQRKNVRNEWELTEEGQKVAEALPYTRGSHSGYQLLWKPEALALLR